MGVTASSSSSSSRCCVAAASALVAVSGTNASRWHAWGTGGAHGDGGRGKVLGDSTQRERVTAAGATRALSRPEAGAAGPVLEANPLLGIERGDFVALLSSLYPREGAREKNEDKTKENK